MIAPAIPEDEEKRLATLRGLNILDTPREERFDRITRIAQKIFNVPIVIITLIDSNRQWFKSSQGVDITETPRSISFCGHAILGNEALVVPDMPLDPRFTDNPLVAGPPHVRFYAGHLLKASNGSRLGTLCIIDKKPRQPDQTELDMLGDLAKLVENELNISDTLENQEVQLRANEAIISATINTALDAVIHIDSDCRITHWNDQAENIFGWPCEEILGHTLNETLIPIKDKAIYTNCLELFATTKNGSISHQRIELSAVHCDGHEIPIELTITPLRTAGSEVFSIFIRDISEIKKIEEERQLASMVYLNSSEAMVIADGQNRIISTNPAYTKITGYSFDEVVGKDSKLFSSTRQDKAFYTAMRNEISTTGQWQGEILDYHKNGDACAKWQTINTIRNDEGTVLRYIAIFTDITEKKLSEELIWKQANFDTLTGLPNRDMFRDRLAQEALKSDRANLPLALLMIDLDHFKEVNDTLGHSVGDILLQEAANRIRACVRGTDTVARLGGDEFTVILPQLFDPNHADNIAQKIIHSLAETFHLGSENVYMSASIGIALYPNDAPDIHILMKHVDQAMYAAKNQGRNRFSYFTPALQHEAQARLRLANDLRSALTDKQFRIYFQPVVEMSSGRIHKAEALLRWQHPERGMVNPMEFIPLAEELGLIIGIGDWVFKESIYWLKQWEAHLLDNFQISVNKSHSHFIDHQVSVNVSPAQFQQGKKEFAEEWLHELQNLGLSGKNIVVEITESLLMKADDNVLDKLLKLRDAGIQVAIDDFGTGYSSLSYLRKFDIDYLKIDQSFVQDLETNPNDRALSEAIIVMAHTLGLEVIAEGVETTGQRDILLAAGCDYAQGYLYSKPIPPDEFEVLLKQGYL